MSETCSDEVFLWSQVRSLEQKNKLLEAEIEAYQGRFEKPTGLRLLYEEQLKELKRIADQMKVQRVRNNITNYIPLGFFPLTFEILVKHEYLHLTELYVLKQRYETSTWCFQGFFTW